MAITHVAVKVPGNTLAAAEWNANHAGIITDIMHGARGAALHADSHARQHAITAALDHTSAATPAQMLQADANGLPVDATNTDAAVAAAVVASHAAATVADTTTVDMTLTGQQVKGDVIKQMSVTSDGAGLKLSGDLAAPGNNKAYATTAGGVKGWRDFPAAAAHNILSLTHGDTTAAAVVKGDVMIGNATPKWVRLGVGADGTALMSQADGTVAWETPPGAALPFGIISLTPGAGVYPSTNPALLYKVDGTNISWDEARFDDTVDESVYFYFIVPPGYDGGNVEFTIYWKATAIVGDVWWKLHTRSVTDADTWDAALVEDSFPLDAVKGVAEQVNTVVVSDDHGWTAGELVQLKIERFATSVSDDMIGDAKLLAVKIKFTYS